ncbi:hypothetical protein L3X38_037715 [Prunus dulcis]|uniref:Nuclease HARBI1 n=1 Tax=Prunus dulcis TaxID=3755 RepID=A0AAD4YPT5_PRUDU|nr:hypothetical protein L3X38_037715 [Prunus dulcis]
MLAYGSSADQVDEIAWIGKSTVLESLVRFCDAVEALYTRDYLRRPTPRDLQRLLQKAESRRFPGMIGDYGNRKWQKSIILEAVAGFDTWVWHPFFGVAGSQNNLNVLGQSPMFNDVLKGEAPNITYEINSTVYQNVYYLADGIYPRGAVRLFDDEVLRSIMMTCIILHNMIVEDEYDYDVDEVYEPNPMDTALTRIYEKSMGPNGEPVQHEPLVRDGSFMPRMIDRYTEMQSSYIHERRHNDDN